MKDSLQMEDSRIIDLFFARDERAISETEKKYSHLFTSIAKRITGSDDDAAECVNDTYLKLWSVIPPARPESLKAYGGRIVRNLSLNRAEYNSAEKRGGGEILAELSDCIPDKERGDGEISHHIDSFLRACDRESRVIFVMRYWYCEPVKGIAKKFGLTEALVKTRLFRTRKKLKSYLEKEGISL